MSHADHTTEVLIAGGGTGGVAAALACAQAGAKCVLVESTDWIGGQLTSQAVPPDENRWIEDFGGTLAYRSMRAQVRAWYRAHRRLIPAARDNPRLNPGNGWVSHLCAEPRVFHAALSELLAPHVTAGRVQIVLNHEPIAASTLGDRISSVTFRNTLSDAPVTYAADYFLDATEYGDLYPLAGVEHAVGAEGRAEYQELHAPALADPRDQQACSWCFAVEHRPGEDHTIAKPPQYDFWRNFIPQMSPDEQPWTGPLFSWTVPSHNQEGRRTFPFIPWPAECPPNVWDMWRYRRITDASLYEGQLSALPGSPPSGAVGYPEHPDVCLVNWVQMDYWLKPLLGVDAAARAQALAEARAQSLCLFYWLQTEAPHHGGDRLGFPGLRLRGEELGTADGFAKHVYVREPYRLRARTMVTEGHIGTAQRTAEGKSPPPNHDIPHQFGLAEPFPDSVGIGHYTLDLHPSCSGRNSVYVPAAPFRIPLGSLIPVRVRNLIAAGKGIGVTHITNGCYRMHHTEWNIGEAAGTLAAWCVAHQLEPHAVHSDRARLAAFQAALQSRGVPLKWPWEPA